MILSVFFHHIQVTESITTEHIQTTTYSVSRQEQRLVSAAQLIQKRIGQLLTAGPQFTCRGECKVSKISSDLINLTCRLQHVCCVIPRHPQANTYHR